MLRVGMTGGIACGKTFIGMLFSVYNVPIIDADLIAREVVLPGSEALSRLKNAFGEGIILSDGTLDRRALREIAFADRDSLDTLNSIMHPAIRQRLDELMRILSLGEKLPDSYLALKSESERKYTTGSEQWTRAFIEPLDATAVLSEKESAPYALMVIPLLFENDLADTVDRVLVIDVQKGKQLERVIKRDRCSYATAEKIISSQIPREERLRRADDVLSTDSHDIEEKRRCVLNLHRKFLQISRSKESGE